MRAKRLWVGLCAVAVVAPLLLASHDATAADPCTADRSSELDPACLPDGTAGQLLRQLCDYQWVEGVCETTRFPEPPYRSTGDPSPEQPLALRIGAVHEHSSYSDGDPLAVPRDYFRAAKTGHNVADAGGDTGVKLDFIWSSEHSDNTQIPFTIGEACAEPARLPECSHMTETHHYWKWPATLRQAMEETEYTEADGYTGFTGIRGFEWTNDIHNHLNVYFSTNFTNVKVDGSYASMQDFWDWLAKPVAEGGGADGLVTFNHPGREPSLTPLDEDLPHNDVLAQVFGSNWEDLAYVPAADPQVAAMEVRGGDDIEWYVKALQRGWHIGAVGAEDEHQLEWATSEDGKTLVLTRGRGPRDYYYALKQHRTIAIQAPLVGGAPGTPATYPTMHFFAGPPSVAGDIQDDRASLLGSVVRGRGPHRLFVETDGLPPGSRLALVSDTGGGQRDPIALGAAGPDGSFSATRSVDPPVSGEDWYFLVVCPASAGRACGSNQDYVAVTAPIWFRR